MKWAVLSLRVAATISLLFFLGHSMGAPWTPENANVAREALLSLPVPSASSSRTYWDFYFGFGVSISLYLLTLTAVLWVSAGLVRVARKAIVFLLVPLAFGYAAVAIVALQYFFALPAILAGCVVGLIICACVSMMRAEPSPCAGVQEITDG